MLSAALLDSGGVAAGWCLGGGGGCALNWIRSSPANLFHGFQLALQAALLVTLACGPMAIGDDQ